MECTEIRELLSPYIDGELSEEDTRKVRSHLESCPECSRLNDELEQGWRLLAASPVPEVSPDFNAKFWTSLRTGKGADTTGSVIRMPARLTLRRIIACAAAALVLVVMGLYFALRGPGDGEMEQLSLEEAEIVENLDVLESLEVVQDLEIIENLDILTELDETDFENL